MINIYFGEKTTTLHLVVIHPPQLSYLLMIPTLQLIKLYYNYNGIQEGMISK
jgi:hypothetical protein